MPEPVVESDLHRICEAGEHWRQMDELREAYPFYWNTEGPGHWTLTRYHDVRKAFQDPATFSNHSIVATDPEPAYRFLPSHLDPPLHMEYRHLVNPWFSPAKVEAIRPRLTELARETIAPLVPLGRTDVIATLADEFPVKAFLTSMGLPITDTEFLRSRVHRLSGKLSDPSGENSDALAAWKEIADYWREAIEVRRRAPLDPTVDLLSDVMRGSVQGRPLPDEDILDLAVTMTFGSLDTMKSQLGWCLYHLATHPEDRARVVADPTAIPDAVEEFLRAYPIVSMARKVTHDVDFQGCPMKAGDMVLLCIQSATRDPRAFERAEEVIIDRSPNRHITFGASTHRCLGSHLARAELQIALQTWHEVIPDYRLDSDEPLRARGGQVTLLSLPLAWSAPA